MLKKKLADAGPEVLAQVSDERNRAEARLRATHGRVAELETISAKLKKELDQVAADNIKVRFRLSPSMYRCWRALGYSCVPYYVRTICASYAR